MSLISFSPLRQQGAGLIEVMVSLLILGVGLLGVLSLQTKGMNSNQRATFVTEAQILAQDMADRIMGFGNNAVGANAGQYGDIAVNKNTTPVDPACSVSGCSADDTVLFDTYEWQAQFSNSSLPGASGTVTWNAPVYTIRVLWDQERTGASNAPDSCTANNDKTNTLTCFELEVR
ncbi:MAG: type IV pilus modification protein PilV [Cellvibrionaceae bacterium]|nr:type IV pilus modification protein PilV [Cellvibrionaceae bacterium]